MYAEKESTNKTDSTTEPEAAVESWEFSSKIPKFEPLLDEMLTDRILKSADRDEGESVANSLTSNSFGSGSEVVEDPGLVTEGSGLVGTSRFCP